MGMIDIHTHVISEDTETYPLAPLGGTQSVWSKDRPVGVAGLLKAMDDAGVTQAVVVQASTAYGFDNRYVADSVDAHPSRLVGVCCVDFLQDTAVAQLEYWIKQRRFVGCRLFSTGSTLPEQGEWLDDPRADAAWGWAEEERLPVCVQMQSAGVPQLRKVLERHPDLVLVLDHAARPNLSGGDPYPEAGDVFALAEFPEIYLKLTSNTFRRAEEHPGGARKLVRRLADIFGAERIAWGSNFPATAGSLPELRARAEAAVVELSAEEQVAFFGETAGRVYKELAGGRE